MSYWPDVATDLVTVDGLRLYRGQPDTLHELVERTVLAHPDATAIRDLAGPTLTYSELWERSGQIAGGFQKSYELAPGDRVAFLMANSADILVGALAAWRAGAVAVTLNTKYTPTELKTQLRQCRARVLVGHDEWLPKADPADVPHIVRAADLPSGELDPQVVGPDEPALLMYTSGTTGLSKGALQSHRNVVSAVETWVRCTGIEPGDTTVVAAPMFHATGLNAQSLPIFAKGGLVTILPRFDADGLAELLAAGEATWFHAAPTIYLLTVRAAGARRAKGLRVGLSGGALVSRELVAAVQGFAEGIDFRISYGMTETSSPAVLTPPGWIEDRPGNAVGVAIPVDDVRLGDGDEILFRGATVIKRYDGDHIANQTAFAGGWLHSGDIGTMDERGFIAVVDRIKDIINRGGEKISSLEVENVLCSHPAVVEAAVVARPDDTYGEVPRAIVVAEGVDAEALRAHCAALLARFKIPVAFDFTEELPRNPGGKILKSLLR